MPRPAVRWLAAAAVGFALAARAGAQAAPELRCPDVRGVNFTALALRCAPDVTIAGGARLSRTACDACAAALFSALEPLYVRAPRACASQQCSQRSQPRLGPPLPQLSAHSDPSHASRHLRAVLTRAQTGASAQEGQSSSPLSACLPTLLPPLAAAGADVAALSQCAGVLGGAPGGTGGGIAAGGGGAPVRYSAACAALPLAPSFSPSWLSRATAGCLAGGACDAACLRRVRDFLRAFARAGCVDEYFAAQRARGAAATTTPGQYGPGASTAGASNAAAAARLALEERAVAALLPVVAAGADDLACARNAAGDFCLSFTDALPASPPSASSASASLGAALLAPAAAPAASGAAATDADPATRCAAWARMGCCAPLVASLGLRAASALTAAVGFADAVAPAPAGAPPPGAAVDAAAARAMLAQLNAQCGRALGAAAPNISTAPCGKADAYLDAAQYDKQPVV
jgi:hypothetical protein